MGHGFGVESDTVRRDDNGLKEPLLCCINLNAITLDRVGGRLDLVNVGPGRLLLIIYMIVIMAVRS
jgi:hypothetical protein